MNSAYRGITNYFVKTLNGVSIGELSDLEKGLRAAKNGFHRMILAPGNILVVMKVAEARRAHPEILSRYGIKRDRRLQ